MFCFFFFFKQKTAYEMRISDWSSDVCSSDLMMIQMRSWLRLPAEAEWLQRLTSVLVDTIGLQWNDTIADDLARARSRWLLARADMRNWSGMITDHDGSAMATYGLEIGRADV